MTTTQWIDRFGTGTLGRITSTVYRVVVIEALIVLTASPGLVLILALAPDASNIPLVALGLLPAGPALSAAIFAWRASETEDVLEPGRHFWRGYRLNALGVLRWWWLVLAIGAVVAINLAHVGAVVPAGAPLAAVVAVQLLVLAALCAIAVHALAIDSLFRFRAIDVLKLAVVCGRRFPGATVAAVATGVAVVGVAWFATELAVVAAAAGIAALIRLTDRPITDHIEETYLS